MPFPNFHAARQKPLSLFSQVRTMKDRFGKGITVIVGIRNGKSENQSIQFDKTKFTPAHARKWLVDHDFKVSDFEEAVQTKRSQVAKCFESDAPSRAFARFKVEEGKVSLTGFDINLLPDDVTEDVISQFSKLGTSLASKKVTAKKSAPADSFNIDMRVLKTDKAEQIVFGVVMEPEVVDGENEITSAAEIKKAAHNYLKKHRVIKHEHENLTSCIPVESFLAPTEFTMKKQKVLKGSWLMGVHVPDKELWRKVESGELNAFSAGGSAQRVAA